MQKKWGSISTAGTLTLADDILALPHDLAEYIVVHKLLHLKFPDHRRGWQVSMGIYLPDWREREWQLCKYALVETHGGKHLADKIVLSAVPSHVPAHIPFEPKERTG